MNPAVLRWLFWYLFCPAKEYMVARMTVQDARQRRKSAYNRQSEERPAFRLFLGACRLSGTRTLTSSSVVLPGFFGSASVLLEGSPRTTTAQRVVQHSVAVPANPLHLRVEPLYNVDSFDIGEFRQKPNPPQMAVHVQRQSASLSIINRRIRD